MRYAPRRASRTSPAGAHRRRLVRRLSDQGLPQRTTSFAWKIDRRIAHYGATASVVEAVPQPPDSKLSEMGHTHHFYSTMGHVFQLVSVISPLADGLWRAPTTSKRARTESANYRKRDDGDLEAPSTTTDPCRRICGRYCGRPGGRRRRRTYATRRRRSRRAPAVSPRTPSRVRAHPIWCRIRLRLARPRPADCRRSTTSRAPERNSGQCIGLSEEEQAQGPMPVPHSTVSSSP